MEIPFSRWYDAIFIRRSRRQYDQRLLEPNLLVTLNTVCKEFRPFPQACAVLVTQSVNDVFKGAIGHYGKIKGAPAFIAFIGNMDNPNIHEQVGYLGEGIILEATALNLGTCWVGGFFRPEVAASLANINKNERVFAVTPIGYASEAWSLEEKIMAGFGRKHQRKPLSELVTGLEEQEWPLRIKEALEGARLAPSAMNRQPWRFQIEQNSITISVDNLKDTFNISKRLDCGIAMLHIEVALLNYCVKGEWDFLEAPRVARYTLRITGETK
ncbi:MAG: nitroreductase [Nitrospira sp.]|nr:nitroreductase [Nitrospira sp.]